MATDIIKYLPLFYEDGVLEMVELTGSEDEEFAAMAHFLPWLIDESTISRASAERVREWESLLAIVPMGTLSQRKMMILATLKGQGKLNEAKIKDIVESFTGDPDAEVTFRNSRIKIRIFPPGNGEIFLFPDVERVLRPLIPVHIGLGVERWYCTWGDIRDNFSDWQAVSGSFTDWNDVKMYCLFL